MKTIYKYPIQITDNQIVEMPEGASILTAQIQEKTLCLWAVVDNSKKSKLRKISIFGTGNPLDNHLNYISTVQESGLVWHIFENLT